MLGSQPCKAMAMATIVRSTGVTRDKGMSRSSSTPRGCRRRSRHAGLLSRADTSESRAFEAGAEGEVLQSSQFEDKAKILMHERHAGRTFALMGELTEPDRTSLQPSGGPGVSRLEPCEDLDEGRLARAVRPDQSVNLRGRDVEGHLRQGHHAGEGLAQTFDTQPDATGCGLLGAHRTADGGHDVTS